MLGADARLLLYTDGVTEGRSPDGEDFGMARLLDLVDRPHASAGQLRDDVLSAIAAWTQGQFDDDVTLLAVVRRDGTQPLFQTQKIRLPGYMRCIALHASCHGQCLRCAQRGDILQVRRSTFGVALSPSTTILRRSPACGRSCTG